MSHLKPYCDQNAEVGRIGCELVRIGCELVTTLKCSYSQLLFSTHLKLLTLKTQRNMHRTPNTFKDILNVKNLTRSTRPKLAIY